MAIKRNQDITQTQSSAAHLLIPDEHLHLVLSRLLRMPRACVRAVAVVDRIRRDGACGPHSHALELRTALDAPIAHEVVRAQTHLEATIVLLAAHVTALRDAPGHHRRDRGGGAGHDHQVEGGTGQRALRVTKPDVELVSGTYHIWEGRTQVEYESNQGP